MGKDFLLRMLVIPQLRTWAVYLAGKDADDIGPDDVAARALVVAAEEIERWLATKQ